MKTITGLQAFDNLLQANAHSRWDMSVRCAEFERTANARLRRSAFVAEYDTDLRINSGDKVFCIGSCFARNVESALRKHSVSVLSGQVDSGVLVTPDTFNIYNTESMLNELRWGLEPHAAFDPRGFLPERDGYIDPHTSKAGVRSIERCLTLRNEIIATTRRLTQCQFLILTLGLVEAWYDTRAGMYLNVRPPRALVVADPARFELHQLDYQATYRALEAIVQLLQRHGQPGAQLVLTVSPVPFLATFSDADVVVANAYSKSVLRCVAQDFSDQHGNVRYVPVYDSIVNTQPDLAWDDDRIHVTEDVVRLNITNFLSKTLTDPTERAAAQRAHARVRDSLERRDAASAGRAPIAEPLPATQRAGLPDFDLDDSNPYAFPQGMPQLKASSSLAEELGPNNLMSGDVVPWHAQPNAPLPQSIDMVFAAPVRVVRLWLQSQDRHPDRAPTAFRLLAGAHGSVHEETALFRHDWGSGGEWASFAVSLRDAWTEFRLEILDNGRPSLLTLQRLWLEPDTWQAHLWAQPVAAAGEPAHAVTAAWSDLRMTAPASGPT